jgi:histone H3/H4
MSREPVDLYQVAQSVMDRLSTAAQSRQVTMTLRGSHAVVEGIDSILEEMIYNLCDNAIKYNHENGHVTVTISDPQGHARIEVQDTGIGIARETPPAVWSVVIGWIKPSRKIVRGAIYRAWVFYCQAWLLLSRAKGAYDRNQRAFGTTFIQF